MLRFLFVCLSLLVLNVGIWATPVFAAKPAPLSNGATAEAQPSATNLFEKLDKLYQQALEATNKQDFATAEAYWTEMLEVFPYNPAVWSNRGNSRVSQNKLDGAIADYNKAIELAPEAPDPYLNRGAALEGMGKWNDAIADYNHVLELDPKDPVAYNNRGSAETGLGDWEAAIADFRKAADLAPDYAFARANQALALYQAGKIDESIRMMRNLVRKYPKFADMRAALTAALWTKGDRGEAESEWVAAVGLDSRYKDVEWLKTIRRWPPSMVTAMEKFLTLKS
ncbi:MAG: tetratricopeptide repeat protein [Oscillatoriales cyanobacterium C42_A2020_001]|nr:tetratricopeptide repeat protein [Leptolyngbyaceae cyanobacterium C42_A2020_001]